MVENLTNSFDIDSLSSEFINSLPFNHVVIDNFWQNDFADNLSEDILTLAKESKDVSIYDSPLEKKITCNQYDKFSANIYKAFTYLNSNNFLSLIKKISNTDKIIPDYGLHGGGIHIHPPKGKLNVHQDYSIHPKLKKERRFNLIIYLTKKWSYDWGGSLELWSHDEKNNKPNIKEKEIEIKYNRAVIFDTTQNSWHGLPNEIKAPKDVLRLSMAIYYLSEPRSGVSDRDRALFAPTKEQEKDSEILELIKKRSSSKTSNEAYRAKKTKD